MRDSPQTNKHATIANEGSDKLWRGRSKEKRSFLFMTKKVITVINSKGGVGKSVRDRPPKGSEGD